MLATRGLTWRIGEVAIVDSVYLDLAPGEFLGVIGPNGAGKTSLFNLITGLRRATEGRVVLDGQDIGALPPHRRARLGLGRTFQASSQRAGAEGEPGAHPGAEVAVVDLLGGVRWWVG
ncbi:ATP-binding cassette domain-containing protein, partial [Micromonospora sp. NPDC048843]|uniref:ATP-binding cassette domain-containing protein n=1 Tax=Micromonospora sp. NPDC048843 TaxID=3155389 RepID=UPI0033F0531F